METKTPIKVLCVDDHPIVRDGIALMLAADQRIGEIATAANGQEALKKFKAFRPDVTLMDLRLTDSHGSDVIAEIRRCSPLARIVALTTYAGDVQALRAIRAGASGFLLKSALRTELLDTILAVYGGQRRICAEVAANMCEYVTADVLTDREIDVLRGVSTGTGNKGIGVELRISEETVRGHLKNIFQKLGAKDRTHAVVIAAQRGFLTI